MIGGEGRIGVEIMEDVYDVDKVIVGIGGGGLIGGIGVGIKCIKGRIGVIGVECEKVEGMGGCLEWGEIRREGSRGRVGDGCDVWGGGNLS